MNIWYLSFLRNKYLNIFIGLNAEKNPANPMQSIQFN